VAPSSALAALLAQARDLKIQQENFTGNRLATTQRLEKAIEDGKELTRRIRTFVISQLGTDSKHLAQFGIPVRGKKGRKKTVPPPPEVVPTPPKPAGPTGQ
jgi:hypothetical protein